MSSTLKIQRKNGKTEVFTDIQKIEYSEKGELINIDIEILDNTQNPQTDYYTESVTIARGENAYLINREGKTSDVIKFRARG